MSQKGRLLEARGTEVSEPGGTEHSVRHDQCFVCDRYLREKRPVIRVANAGANSTNCVSTSLSKSDAVCRQISIALYVDSSLRELQQIPTIFIRTLISLHEFSC